MATRSSAGASSEIPSFRESPEFDLVQSRRSPLGARRSSAAVLFSTCYLPVMVELPPCYRACYFPVRRAKAQSAFSRTIMEFHDFLGKRRNREGAILRVFCRYQGKSIAAGARFRGRLGGGACGFSASGLRSEVRRVSVASGPLRSESMMAYGGNGDGRAS